jgi:hypothetical protein
MVHHLREGGCLDFASVFDGMLLFDLLSMSGGGSADESIVVVSFGGPLVLGVVAVEAVDIVDPKGRLVAWFHDVAVRMRASVALHAADQPGFLNQSPVLLDNLRPARARCNLLQPGAAVV